jgi:hypothetical protein
MDISSEVAGPRFSYRVISMTRVLLSIEDLVRRLRGHSRAADLAGYLTLFSGAPSVRLNWIDTLKLWGSVPMFAHTFDELTVWFGRAASRRTALRGVGAVATLALLGRPREAAAVCKNDRAMCERNLQCCSGACRKTGKKKKGRKRTKRCQHDPEARGCTIEAQCLEVPEMPARKSAVASAR